MMDSFPDCNKVTGQRALSILTDDVIKASELVLKSGRIPIMFSGILDFARASSLEDEVVEVMVNGSFNKRDDLETMVFIFDCYEHMRNMSRFINLFASAFCTVQFKVESTFGSLYEQINRSRLDSGLNLGSFRYCHCEELTVQVPRLFYYVNSIDKNRDWVSLECAARDSDICLAYSRAFNQRFVFNDTLRFKCFVGSNNLSVIGRDDFLNWSAHTVDTAVDAIVDLTVAFYDTWKIQQPW